MSLRSKYWGFHMKSGTFLNSWQIKLDNLELNSDMLRTFDSCCSEFRGEPIYKSCFQAVSSLSEQSDFFKIHDFWSKIDLRQLLKRKLEELEITVSFRLKENLSEYELTKYQKCAITTSLIFAKLKKSHPKKFPKIFFSRFSWKLYVNSHYY